MSLGCPQDVPKMSLKERQLQCTKGVCWGAAGAEFSRNVPKMSLKCPLSECHTPHKPARECGISLGCPLDVPKMSLKERLLQRTKGVRWGAAGTECPWNVPKMSLKCP
jgi:hypothetical protein